MPGKTPPRAPNNLRDTPEVGDRKPLRSASRKETPDDSRTPSPPELSAFRLFAVSGLSMDETGGFGGMSSASSPPPGSRLPALLGRAS
jgi:hypothetical protein